MSEGKNGPSEVEQLRAEVAELRELVRNGNRGPGEIKILHVPHDHAAHSAKARAAFDAQQAKVAADAEALRLDGPRRFRVQLMDEVIRNGQQINGRSCPALICGGLSEADSIARYRAFFGIQKTQHDFIVEEVAA